MVKFEDKQLMTSPIVNIRMPKGITYPCY